LQPFRQEKPQRPVPAEFVFPQQFPVLSRIGVDYGASPLEPFPLFPAGEAAAFLGYQGTSASVAVFRIGLSGGKKLYTAGIAEAEDRLFPADKGFAAKGAIPGKEEFPKGGEKGLDFHTLYKGAGMRGACMNLYEKEKIDELVPKAEVLEQPQTCGGNQGPGERAE
jgi:hypothetical protein